MITQLLYFQECTRSCPRGNPAHHLPLIAIYTANWPPRDDYSLSIIAISRAKGHSEKSPTKGNDQSPGENEEERGAGKRKLSFSEEEEGREDSLSHPPKRKKKKKQNSRKDKRKDSLADEDEREGTSLLVTVDSGGSRATSSSNKRGSLSSSRDLDRSGPSALLVTPSPAYTSRPRPLIKSTPVTPLSAGNYPRESFNDSSYHHSNHHPSHRYRGDPYRNASYTPTTTFIPPIMTNHQRTLSVDNDHRPRPPRPPPLMNRRHSDYDRYYTPPGLHQPRGQYLEADRGFRISEQTARQVGYYRKDSNEPQRHWETGQNSYDSRRRPPHDNRF